VVILAVAAGVSLAARAGVGLNLSASAPRGLYRTVAGAPTHGALVVICLPPDVAVFGLARGYLGAGTCPGGAQPALKRVAAVAGDTVDLDGAGAIVNGVRLLGQPISDRDGSGRPLPHLPFGRHVVNASDVWLAGQSHARSWDSRYFGPVPVTGLRGIARPVFMLGEASR
jgi:conjugative transfer signal peptidase TraF